MQNCTKISYMQFTYSNKSTKSINHYWFILIHVTITLHKFLISSIFFLSSLRGQTQTRGHMDRHRHTQRQTPLETVFIEQGLTSHQTHYRSYWGRVFTGHMTKPSVSKQY